MRSTFSFCCGTAAAPAFTSGGPLVPRRRVETLATFGLLAGQALDQHADRDDRRAGGDDVLENVQERHI